MEASCPRSAEGGLAFSGPPELIHPGLEANRERRCGLVRGKELLVGITGSVAAYKAAELVSKAVQAGARVSVVLTEAAQHFVGPATFEALTGRPVGVDLFQPREFFIGEHIGLAQRADLICVAPATAQTLAALAHGFADSLLLATVLAFNGPVVLAPAMNAEMWAKAAVQRNVAQLRQDGYYIVEPQEGWLSCRQVGAGRMAPPEEVLSVIAKLLTSQAK
jgi:phosphopantothenoylcysteine decarboxylase